METTIVLAALAGDRDALGTIVDELTPTVLGAAFGLCGWWDVAGDIAQEAFATIIVRLGDLRGPGGARPRRHDRRARRLPGAAVLRC